MVIRAALSAVALVLGLLASATTATAAGYEESTHPWDFPPRLSGHRNLFGDYDDVQSYYYYAPQRSVTHALHPLNRRRYYNPRPYSFINGGIRYSDYSNTDLYEFNSQNGQWARTDGEGVGTPPIGVECSNYRFDRPNYRVPPFGYHCER